MNYSELSKEQLEVRLERAYKKLYTLKTQGGVWAMEGEINACKKALEELESFKCNCDCECSKENDRADDQCDDCDNGIHWDNIRKIFVNYEEEEELK